jgi:hypothetical protein
MHHVNISDETSLAFRAHFLFWPRNQDPLQRLIISIIPNDPFVCEQHDLLEKEIEQYQMSRL